MTYKLCDSLLEKCVGPLICKMDGTEKVYSSASDLLKQQFDKKVIVSEISARDGMIVVSLEENTKILNDLSADWAKEHLGNR